MSDATRNEIEQLSDDEVVEEQPNRRSLLKLAGGASLAALLGLGASQAAGAQVSTSGVAAADDDDDDKGKRKRKRKGKGKRK